MRFPIAFKIMSLFSLLAAAIIALLTYNFYEYSYQELESKYGTKLRHVAATTAVNISGELHDAIHARNDFNGVPFKTIKSYLERIRIANNLHYERIYTFRPLSERELKWCVMLHPNPFIGDIYKVPEVNQALVERVLAGEAVSTRIYGDDHGYWISGIAPIKDASGRVRGVLYVDNQVDVFLAELNGKTRTILYISLAVLLGGLVVSYLFSRAISGPIRRLQHAANAVKQGDYSIRVDVKSRDELADLAGAYNTMADEVKDHTVALESALLQNTAILNTMIDGIIALDTTCRVLRANPAFYAMTDTGGPLEGRWLTGRNFPEIFALIRSSEKQGGVVHGEVSLLEDRVGKATASALERTDENGQKENIGYLVLVRDITREKEVDRMKTEFISNVSHELRTPLTSVLGFAKLIKRKLDESIFPAVQSEEKKVNRAVRQVNENISIIVSEGERLTNLINDVLDIAKMEAGKLDWKMAELSVNEVVQRAITATSALFTAQDQVRVVTDFGDDLPVVVGDHDRILQVVINLISNAAKFTDEGSVTLRTTMSDQEEIIVSVLDTGPGIPPEDRPLVFEKFKQVGDTMTDKPRGTGLGLPICRQIIEYHGGTIQVSGNEPRGSHFWFSLPIKSSKRVHTEDVDLNGLVERLREDNVQAQRHRVQSPRKILVVDDEEPIRNLLRQELESAGYQVMEAGDGLAAIASVKKEKPHLIILDVMMPRLSGFDTAAILKNDPLMMDIPILILSIVQNRERGLDIGVDAYLNKPINTDELLGEIRRLLDRGASPKRVMVMDEDRSTLETLTELLKSRGHTVVSAANGHDGIKAARDAKPDMIIIGSLVPEDLDIVKTLKFEKDLEHVLFFVLGNKGDADSS